MTTVDGMFAPSRAASRPARRARRVPVAAAVSGLVALALIAAALAAPVLRPFDTRAVALDQALQPPSVAHPLGTDHLGRDILAQTLHGLRVSFSISLLAAGVAVAIGSAVGILSGAYGRWLDAFLMRLVDVFLSQNHFLMGILVVVLFRPVVGPAGAILLHVGLTHWASLARIVRAEVLSLRERPFVLAAIQGGASRWRVMWRHLVPHLMPYIALAYILLVPHAIFHESALSFLGLGMPPSQPSLGNILAESRATVHQGAWWHALFPGLAIFIAALCVATLGEYWRDRHHPRWRSELEL